MRRRKSQRALRGGINCAIGMALKLGLVGRTCLKRARVNPAQHCGCKCGGCCPGEKSAASSCGRGLLLGFGHRLTCVEALPKIKTRAEGQF